MCSVGCYSSCCDTTSCCYVACAESCITDKEGQVKLARQIFDQELPFLLKTPHPDYDKRAVSRAELRDLAFKIFKSYADQGDVDLQIEYSEKALSHTYKHLQQPCDAADRKTDCFCRIDWKVCQCEALFLQAQKYLVALSKNHDSKATALLDKYVGVVHWSPYGDKRKAGEPNTFDQAYDDWKNYKEIHPSDAERTQRKNAAEKISRIVDENAARERLHKEKPELAVMERLEKERTEAINKNTAAIKDLRGALDTATNNLYL